MIPVNTILQTKDGRKVGNAIVKAIDTPFYGIHFIITDDGNHLRLKETEVRALFYIGPVATPEHKNYRKPVT